MASGADHQPTADECIRAGMYWFGRSDFEAARAWWERAVQLDPANSRAQECLRLLDKTASVGFKSEVLAVEPPTSNPMSPTPPAGVARPDWSQRGVSSGDAPEENDAFEFAADAQREEAEAISSQDLPAVTAEASPWDEGPERTPAITLHPLRSYDALAEATPLPEIDKGRFFGRDAVDSEQEIRSFLEATGDLTPPEPGHPPWPKELSTHVIPPIEVPRGDLTDIVFDDPVEAPDAAEDHPMSPKRALEEASRRLQLHDFNGVLELVESIPKDAQGDEARRLIAEARRNLTKMFESKIGDFERIPRVQISEEEVIWLNLNHRAGFVLSQIDGTVSFEDLLALSGMPRLDTLRVLADLLDKNVIA